MSARRTAWRWWAGASALATTGYFLLPLDTAVQRLTFAAFGFICAVAVLAGVRLHRPRRPGVWYCFAASGLTTTAANAIVAYYQERPGGVPYPSAADVFYTLSYPLIAIGLLAMLRARHGRSAAGLLDAAMATTAIGLAFWVFVLHPVAAGSGASIAQRILGTEYPCWDVLLVALLARLHLGGGGRITTSDRLLGLAVTLLTAGDATFALLSLHGSAYGVGSLIWLPAYALFGAAALHPSMGPAAVAARQRDQARVRPMRLALLAAACLSAPFLLFVPGIGADPASPASAGPRPSTNARPNTPASAPRCAPRSTAASSGSSTSRSSTCPRAASGPSRPWSAGSTRNAAWSARSSSCRSPSRTV